MSPALQLALDFVNLKRALKIAEKAVPRGVDRIEAGTPLIKSEGLDVVRALRRKFPNKTIVADMKIMDAGRIEVESAAKSGANVITVLGAASDATLRESVEAAANYGAKIEVDLVGVKNAPRRAAEAEKIGADFIGVHCAIDEQMEGKDSFKRLTDVVNAVKIPVVVAGGLNSETVRKAIACGASILVVGGAIIKASDPAKATSRIKTAITRKKSLKTKFFKRVSEKNICDIFRKVSTANLSDAMHRSGELKNIPPVHKPVKAFGRVITVRTYPGDWAKPVEAVDRANPGDVIVIDAGGVGPAVWGELTTHGAIQKKIAAVIINGAVRDTDEIKKLKFPVCARLITPTAGEPKGFGEINVPLTVDGVKIHPGDWAVIDSDGAVIVPDKKAVEIANRSMSVLEAENRLRKEIDAGSTLAGVTELLRWEKVR
ncbi:MAG: orotidine 5'-phosphate decarboxylase [Candidatus Omnitrophica bacterium]|nr:orotidine 5'-phosphate decarboxylase [Candidatus Omnitrophota bacterium]